MNRQQQATLLRATIGIVLLALLLYWVGLDDLSQAVTRFHPTWYALALAVIFLHFLVQSLVIRILLHTKNILVKARSVFRLTVISQFFGVFLPGGIGPDMVLCYNMARSAEKKEDVLSAIIFIRITILFMMVLLAALFSFHPLSPGPQVKLATALILLAFLAYFILTSNRHTLALAERLLSILNRHRFTGLLYKTYFALSSYSRNLAPALKCAPLILLSAIIKIITDYFVARSLGIHIPLLYFFIFIPTITVISAIPLTFAGLGVREASYAALFALAGVPPAEAITVSLVSFTLVFVTAIIGAALYTLKGTDIITRDTGEPPP